MESTVSAFEMFKGYQQKFAQVHAGKKKPKKRRLQEAIGNKIKVTINKKKSRLNGVTEPKEKINGQNATVPILFKSNIANYTSARRVKGKCIKQEEGSIEDDVLSPPTPHMENASKKHIYPTPEKISSKRLKTKQTKPYVLKPSTSKKYYSDQSSNYELLEDNLNSINEDSILFEPVHTDSEVEGLKALEWLIAPYKAENFLNNIWEKTPLHIARKKSKYYKNIISTPIIDNMLRTENIMYTKNIDITSYTDGKRETHNPVGRAHPHTVWDYYLNGCSIRLLNPQTYIQSLQLLNATLQEFFNSFVGANAYLTPPDSQGFAPHHDDIEALIMQIEGKKHWRVYKPRSENEILPRESSKNFDQDEIGEPALEVTLEAGDMLYFPRGWIHQGETVDGEHSLHITISFYQKHSWADLLEKILPAALEEAIAENVDLRKGLPFDIYENFGLVNSDLNTPRKQEITNMIHSLFDRIKNHLRVDYAVDELAKRFQHTALPPVLNDVEKAVTVYGDSDVMVENGKVTQRVEIDLDTRVRLLRKKILRMVQEEDGIRVYFYAENSLEYEGHAPQFLEIDEKFAPAVETLIVSYPKYVAVENLDVEDDIDKIQIANDLWENGLIMTEYPLPTEDE